MARSILAMMVLISFLAQPIWAQNSPPSVAEQVNKVNGFNRLTDYWAGLGKNDIQKISVINQRKEERRIKRLQSLTRKKELARQRREAKITKDMKRFLRHKKRSSQ